MRINLKFLKEYTFLRITRLHPSLLIGYFALQFLLRRAILYTLKGNSSINEDSVCSRVKRLRECLYRTYKIFMRSYSEKGRGTSSFESPVFDFRLLCKILRALDRWIHPLDGKERGQVGSVRRNHDQSEEPPHTRHYASRHGPVRKIPNGAEKLP